VPRYRFHHVEITKNILSHNTAMKFIPFQRDVQNAVEEATYNKWIDELKDMDRTMGMDNAVGLDPPAKADKCMKEEYAATLYVYIERWIQRLGLKHCNMSALIRYMASQTADDDTAITPQQKSSLLVSSAPGATSPHSDDAAKAFTEAFDRVFGEQTTLRDVLMLDEAVKAQLEHKTVKDTPSSQKPRDEVLFHHTEQFLATYSVLGCVLCYGHDCEHGEFGKDNNKTAFSVETQLGGLAPLLRKKWIEQTKKEQDPSYKKSVTPCRNECFLDGYPANPVSEWTTDEIDVLKSMFATLNKSSLQTECAVATILGRKCWDVHAKIGALNLHLPYIPLPPELPKAKNVVWYDRTRKQLIGDWKDCTVSHQHDSRLVDEPCHHEGPCSAANKCPCVLNKLLCERFCQCDPDCCPYKFTGCACHSTGKTCLQRQREGKPCICIQLNRECDPVLCTSCGAAQRADQLNAHDEALHATGCQNVSLQRGVSKAVLMGKSQLEGCGYGLFTAEDIAQDEFVIEYAGELITHDEGVRREARRGNVFDTNKNTSYLFTLLELEATWVDAAIYGNLSRYINHAGDTDKRGANIVPKIVYVNGEFRIEFLALRDIKTGEELFFNYGENFPNLTKRLLDHKESQAAGTQRKATTAPSKDKDGPPKRKPGRPPKAKTGRGGARPQLTKQAPPRTIPEEDPMDWEADISPDEAEVSPINTSKGGRRRRAIVPPLPEEDDDMDEYQPEATEEDMEDYTLARDRARRKGRANQTLRHFVTGQYDEELRAAAAAGGGLGGSDSKKVAGPTASKAAAAAESPASKEKRVSRRGGARPGAGRKPKNPRPAAHRARAASSAGDDENDAEETEVDSNVTEEVADEDSDDLPIERGRGQRARGPRKRKRKAGELPDSDEEEEDDDEDDGQEPDISELGGRNDEDDEDDDDVIIRKRERRNRQKPARYRVEDE
jgi:hypothetical protein